jgi:hypothetical protein
MEQQLKNLPDYSNYAEKCKNFNVLSVSSDEESESLFEDKAPNIGCIHKLAQQKSSESLRNCKNLDNGVSKLNMNSWNEDSKRSSNAMLPIKGNNVRTTVVCL